MIKHSSSTDFKKFLNQKKRQQNDTTSIATSPETISDTSSLNNDDTNQSDSHHSHSHHSDSHQTDSYPNEQYYIYNPKNKLIREHNIHEIMELAGIENYKVRDLSNWITAFTHSSYCHSKKKNQMDSSIIAKPSREHIMRSVPIQNTTLEGLEWLGDAIIQSIIGFYLYRRFPDKREDEEFLTKIRSKHVKKVTLAFLSKSLGFDKFILMSDYHEEAKNGRQNAGTLEDAFEAFVGAMAIDIDPNVNMAITDMNDMEFYSMFVPDPLCAKFFINCIEKYVDITDFIMYDDNYKDQLMRYFQRMFGGKYPVYHRDESNINVKDGKQDYHMYVLDVNGNKIGEGMSRKKKEAEQKAAKQALFHYGVLTHMNT